VSLQANEFRTMKQLLKSIGVQSGYNARVTVKVTGGAGSATGGGVVTSPVALFQTHLANGVNVLGNKPQYAVARDGRFLLNTAIESASPPIVVSVNWMRKLSK